jgi:hypothetical protein
MATVHCLVPQAQDITVDLTVSMAFGDSVQTTRMPSLIVDLPAFASIRSLAPVVAIPYTEMQGHQRLLGTLRESNGGMLH